MFTPLSDAKLLDILSCQKGALLVDFPCMYPPANKEERNLDVVIMQAVTLYNHAIGHNNKYMDKFRAVNIAERLHLELLPGSLHRFLSTMQAVVQDSLESEGEMKMVGFRIMFNFKDGECYRSTDRFFRKSKLGIFLGVQFSVKGVVKEPLYEQMYWANQDGPLVAPKVQEVAVAA